MLGSLLSDDGHASVWEGTRHHDILAEHMVAEQEPAAPGLQKSHSSL